MRVYVFSVRWCCLFAAVWCLSSPVVAFHYSFFTTLVSQEDVQRTFKIQRHPVETSAEIRFLLTPTTELLRTRNSSLVSGSRERMNAVTASAFNFISRPSYPEIYHHAVNSVHSGRPVWLLSYLSQHGGSIEIGAYVELPEWYGFDGTRPTFIVVRAIPFIDVSGESTKTYYIVHLRSLTGMEITVHYTIQGDRIYMAVYQGHLSSHAEMNAGNLAGYIVASREPIQKDVASRPSGSSAFPDHQQKDDDFDDGCKQNTKGQCSYIVH